MPKDKLPRLLKRDLRSFLSREPEGEVAFNGGRKIARALVEDGPRPIVPLLRKHSLDESFLDFRIDFPEKVHELDKSGPDRLVGLEGVPPVAFFALMREEKRDRFLITDFK